jgi:peptide/nickel transport system substrate-binding protein
MTASAAMFVVGAVLLTASAFARPSAPSGGSLRLGWYRYVEHIDPARGGLRELHYATGALLLNYPDAPAPRGSRLIPEVAAGFPTVSPDGRTYTFRLRTTYRFSNGRRVRAANFVRAFERARRLPPSSAARQLAADIRSAHTPAPYTLRIRTTTRTPDLLARLATPFFMAVPGDLSIDSERVAAPLHSAGPYYFREWVPKQRIVLERNQFYRGPRPHNVDRIEVEVPVLDEEVKANIDRGSTDAGDISPDAHAELGRRFGVKRRSPGRYFVNPRPAIVYLALNEERELFRGNVRLRQAVNFAIDRRAMVLEYGPYAASVHDQLLPPGIRGFIDFKLYPRRPNLARARSLAEGHLRSGKARLWCPFGFPGAQVCQLVGTSLREIGLEVAVVMDPRCSSASICNPTQRGMAWDMVLWSHRAGYLDPYDFLRLVDGTTIRAFDNTNVSYFRHRGFDARIARANRLLGEARYRAFSAIDRDVMRKAAPVAVIAMLNDRHYVSARTGCYHYHPVYGFDLPAICLNR